MGEDEEVLGSEPLRFEPCREVLALCVATSDVHGRSGEKSGQDRFWDRESDDAASESGLNCTKGGSSGAADDERELTEAERVLSTERLLIQATELGNELLLEEVYVRSEGWATSKRRIGDERLTVARLPAKPWEGREKRESAKTTGWFPGRSEPRVNELDQGSGWGLRIEDGDAACSNLHHLGVFRRRMARNDLRDFVGKPAAPCEHDDFPPGTDVPENLSLREAPPAREHGERRDLGGERRNEGEHVSCLVSPVAALDQDEVRVMRLEWNLALTPRLAPGCRRCLQ